MPSTSRSTDLDDSESETSASETDSSDSDDISIGDSDDDSEDEVAKPKARQLSEGNYILAQFTGKKLSKYYIGKIESVDIDSDTVDAMFLKRKPTKSGQFQFSYPENLDASEAPIADILFKLQAPISGGTARTGDIFTFKSQMLDSFQ